MTNAESYRTKANRLRAKAKQETDPFIRADHERLAHSYEAIADQLSAAQSADTTNTYNNKTDDA